MDPEVITPHGFVRYEKDCTLVHHKNLSVKLFTDHVDVLWFLVSTWHTSKTTLEDFQQIQALILAKKYDDLYDYCVKIF